MVRPRFTNPACLMLIAAGLCAQTPVVNSVVNSYSQSAQVSPGSLADIVGANLLYTGPGTGTGSLFMSEFQRGRVVSPGADYEVPRSVLASTF